MTFVIPSRNLFRRGCSIAAMCVCKCVQISDIFTTNLILMHTKPENDDLALRNVIQLYLKIIFSKTTDPFNCFLSIGRFIAQLWQNQ